MKQTRRDFVTTLSAAGAVGLMGGSAEAEEGPPETTTVRLPRNTNICLAPLYVAEELLRAEGFTEIRFVPAQGGFTFPEMAGRGEIDFGASFAGSVVFHRAAGVPIVAVGGVHSGCYELFAREPIHTIADLKGKSIAISTLTASAYLYLSIMAAHVGLDPHKDINWVVTSELNPLEQFVNGSTDAFLGFPP